MGAVDRGLAVRGARGANGGGLQSQPMSQPPATRQHPLPAGLTVEALRGSRGELELGPFFFLVFVFGQQRESTERERERELLNGQDN